MSSQKHKIAKIFSAIIKWLYSLNFWGHFRGFLRQAELTAAEGGGSLHVALREAAVTGPELLGGAFAHGGYGVIAALPNLVVGQEIGA